MNAEQLAVSPCSNPDMELEPVLEAYSRLGYHKFEVFTSWAKSAFDYHGDPEFYRAKGCQYDMAFTSMHLPRIDNDIGASVKEAIQATKFAKAIGVKVVIYKASSRENYIAGALSFLEGIDGLGVTPVIQNHVGTPITTLEDYRAMIGGINNTRMKTVLEIGMFCSVGVPWSEACDTLGDSIALVHLKDQIREKRVPFGKGEVDFAGLFRHMDARGYLGNYVVEMEVDREDQERTLQLLGNAHQYLSQVCQEG